MEAKRGHVTSTNLSHQVTVEEVVESTPKAIKRAWCPQVERLGGMSTKVDSQIAPFQEDPESHPAGPGRPAGWGSGVPSALAGEWLQ